MAIASLRDCCAARPDMGSWAADGLRGLSDIVDNAMFVRPVWRLLRHNRSLFQLFIPAASRCRKSWVEEAERRYIEGIGPDEDIMILFHDIVIENTNNVPLTFTMQIARHKLP
jgi:hypothetical protein